MAAPKNLDDLKNEGHLRDPFPAPEGYFDTLSERLQQRIDEENSGLNPSSQKLIRMQPRWYYAAATVAILMVSAWLITSSLRSSAPVATANEDDAAQSILADVSNEALIDYLQMNNVDIFTTVSLTEIEQEELLDAELESYELPEEYYPASEYDEDYL